MASGFGILLILLGGFLLAIGYGTLSHCTTSPPYSNCWDPFHPPYRSGYDFQSGDFAFYAGAIIATLGAVILAGPNIGRLLGKLRGAGSDSEQ